MVERMKKADAPNKKNERFFLRLVKDGYLSVKKSGKVFNNDTGRFIGHRHNAGYLTLDVLDANGKFETHINT